MTHEARKCLLAVLQQVVTAEAHIVLSAVHVVLQLTEGHLRLNHPELRQVAARVTICATQCASIAETGVPLVMWARQLRQTSSKDI